MAAGEAKPPSVRTRKMASVIQKEISEIILRELNDPRLQKLGMITVSHVDLAGDHRNATVHVSFMGQRTEKKEAKAAVKLLNGAAPFFRRSLAKRMQTKVVPQVNFRYDESFDRAAKVHQAFIRAAKTGEEEE